LKVGRRERHGGVEPADDHRVEAYVGLVQQAKLEQLAEGIPAVFNVYSWGAL